jgi:hypothetical protein
MFILISQGGYVKRVQLTVNGVHRGSKGTTLNAGWLKILMEPKEITIWSC